jgi:hypothetical protein
MHRQRDAHSLFFAPAVTIQCRADCLLQLSWLARFHQQAEDAPVVDGVGHFFRDQHSHGVRSQVARAPQELHAIQSGHLHVSNNGGIGTTVA